MNIDYSRLNWNRIYSLYNNQVPEKIGGGLAYKPMVVIIQEEWNRIVKEEGLKDTDSEKY